MKMPKLFGEDLPALLRWARAVIVAFEQEEIVSTSFAGEVLVNPGLPPEETLEGESSPSALVIGTCLPLYGATIPTGWLEMGALAWRADYPELFSLIGVLHDPSPPGATFRLPPYPTTLGPHGRWIMKAVP